MKIYSLTDRISIQIGELTFKLAPLSYKQKLDIHSAVASGREVEGVFLGVKYAVKHVEGLEKMDGSKYELSFENEVLTEQCVEELLNTEVGTELQNICVSLIGGISDKIINPSNGKVMEGVEVKSNPKKGRKKKSSSR